MLLRADTEGSDQTGWMPRLIRVFAGHTGHFVGFVMRQLHHAKTRYCEPTYFPPRYLFSQLSQKEIFVKINHWENSVC